MVEIKLTHKGWLGFAPIYIGAPFTDCPFLKCRIPGMDWLINLNAAMFNLVSRTHGYTSGFPIRITGMLGVPKLYRLEE